MIIPSDLQEEIVRDEPDTAERMQVLAIEDDLATLRNLSDILEMDGYELFPASSFAEALLFKNFATLDAILLDRKLPDGVADQILPTLKKLAPDAALIVITGQADLEGIITALRHGAVDYLIKPINPDLLRAALARSALLREAEKRALQSERLAAIGQMVTGLAHESGNALARAQACLEMLELVVAGNQEAENLISRIQRAQNDLQRLFEEIRGYAAPLKLKLIWQNIGYVWRQAWDHLGFQHRNRQVVFHESCSQDSLFCRIDAFRMEQVFRNIFDNSLAACSDPVNLQIICHTVVHHGLPALLLQIQDNGPGLSTEQIEKIFTPFYTTKTKGTGLGMAIVRRIIEAHGGLILAGKGPSGGAEIRITLPRGDP